MLARKLFVSATDAAGGFSGRGMVSLAKALETLGAFFEAGEGERAVFMVLSDHDGRIELRHGPGGLVGVITARAARDAALGGLLPKRDAMIWRVDGLSRAEAEGIVTALYRLSGAAFRAQVNRELTE